MRFWGTDLFMDSYAEVGTSLVGIPVGPMDIEMAAAYVFGREYDSISLRLKFRF